MSLLDRGHELVQVQPHTWGSDVDGNPTLVPGAWTWIRCSNRPATTDEVEALGLVSSTDRVLTHRTWPTDGNGVVRWDGRTWDIIGEPEVSTGRKATRHYTVRIRARTPKRVPL